ncbi:hypothetical protein ACLOJK_034437, partial [Asimina triloba]
ESGYATAGADRGGPLIFSFLHFVIEEGSPQNLNLDNGSSALNTATVGHWSNREEANAVDTMLMKMLVVAGEGAVRSTWIWARLSDGEDDAGLPSKVAAGRSLLDGPPVTLAGHG